MLVERPLDSDRGELVIHDELGERRIATDVTLRGREQVARSDFTNHVPQVQIALGDPHYLLAADFAQVSLFTFRHSSWLLEAVVDFPQGAASVRSGWTSIRAFGSKGLEMQVEHLALNVPDVLSMARWYVDHLGFSVLRRSVHPPYAHFIADAVRGTVLELYTRDDAPIPDYAAMHPGTFHLALRSEDVAADIARLVAAGGQQEGTTDHTPAGDELAFVRDPWGVCLQLVRRAQPLL